MPNAKFTPEAQEIINNVESWSFHISPEPLRCAICHCHIWGMPLLLWKSAGKVKKKEVKDETTMLAFHIEEALLNVSSFNDDRCENCAHLSTFLIDGIKKTTHYCNLKQEDVYLLDCCSEHESESPDAKDPT